VSAQGLRRFASNLLAMAYREGTVMRHDRAFMAVVTVQPRAEIGPTSMAKHVHFMSFIGLSSE